MKEEVVQNLNQLLKIISILSDGQFHSGASIGVALGLSKVTVNRYIQTLCHLGVDIVAVSGCGYQLKQKWRLLDEKEIARQCINFNSRQFFLIPIIDSTNQFLLDRVNDLHSGAVCVAEYQYSGRGRRGRRWFSPFGSNVYFSIYWRLQTSALTPTFGRLSLAVGVVVSKLLRRLSQKDIKLKWPNDLYLEGKKLAGILIETVGCNSDVLHIVIGVGINLMMSLPKDQPAIDQAWIGLDGVDKTTLVAQLITSLSKLMTKVERDDWMDFVDQWNKLDYCINKPVKLVVGDHRLVYGIYRGINEQGAVLLEQGDQIRSYLGSDVSLRLSR